jgi:hypothetical protein
VSSSPASRLLSPPGVERAFLLNEEGVALASCLVEQGGRGSGDFDVSSGAVAELVVLLATMLGDAWLKRFAYVLGHAGGSDSAAWAPGAVHRRHPQAGAGPHVHHPSLQCVVATAMERSALRPAQGIRHS